tara:strand:+ start:53393 stop:53494 length:102 start_codon:yes stop_codon:yes gene_type:complete
MEGKAGALRNRSPARMAIIHYPSGKLKVMYVKY